MDELIALITKTYGLAGILLALPAYAALVLWKDNKLLRGDLIKAKDDAAKAQEQRVSDAQQVASKLFEMGTAQSALNKETNMVLDRLVGVVEQNQTLLSRAAQRSE